MTANTPIEPPAALTKTPEKYRFKQVADAAGNRIRQLWVRNGRYYYQTCLNGKTSRRIRLSGANTIAQAVKAAEVFRVDRNRGILSHIPGRTPTLHDYTARYLGFLTETATKNCATIISERTQLNNWCRHFGQLAIGKINRKTLQDFVSLRKQEGVGNRSVNLAVMVLGNLLKHARKEGVLNLPPVTNEFEYLTHRPKHRDLVTKETIDKVVAELLRVKADGSSAYRNGRLVSDYVLLLAYSGARKTSATFIKWCDIDWENRQLRLTKTKFSKRLVVVDFNEQLEKHLLDMQARRVLGSDYLFPAVTSLRLEADLDSPMGEVRGTLDRAAAAVGAAGFRIHDLRHFFISCCVMAKIDFLTIAKWVGHLDGGVLIGKTYGHLDNEHTQAAARKVTFAVVAGADPLVEERAELAQKSAALDALIAKLKGVGA